MSILFSIVGIKKKKKIKISEQMIQNKYHAHVEASGTKTELEYLRKGKTM